jgi:hypothetical protein
VRQRHGKPTLPVFFFCDGGVDETGIVWYSKHMKTTTAQTVPTNWNMGWNDDWKIGSGGMETPYPLNGRWYLRVYNVRTQRHGVYDFSVDMIEEETV